MKNIKGSLIAKIIAIFLFVIFTATTVFSIVGIVFLAQEDAYFDDGREAKEAVIDLAASSYWDRLYRYIDYILMNGWTEYEEDFEEEYGGDCNFYFEIKDMEGNIVLSNYRDVKHQRAYNRTYGTHYYDNGVYRTETYYQIYAIIPAELEVKDSFYYLVELGDWLINMRFWLIGIALLSFALMVIVFIFMMCAAGHKKGTDEIVPNFMDKIPFDIYLAAFMLIFAFTVYLLDEIVYNDAIALVAVPFACFVWVLMFISLSMTFATRVKLGTVFKNTIIMWIFKGLWQAIKFVFRMMASVPLFIKSAALYVLICGVEFFFLICGYGVFATFWVLEKCALGLMLFALLVSLRKLLVAGRRISSGDLDYKVDTSFMFFELKEHADNLNEIGAGLQGAVDKSIKSERMKAELITNVSHDIKTPLTSIINYVDLLKREGLDSENAGEYLDVLDRQSARLKKLTEDLIEASKASTGNIKVNAEKLDANILLSQAVGEYEEKFTDKNLCMVTDMADGELYVWADGRLLWRVFDNMLNNIVKYAKQDTRVYISTSKVNHEISIVFKNISDAALNISSDELMERFVRGDSSRNTEGSGLGLSIAKSLTELMGGRFEITIDGDLFKCSMTFAEKNN